MGGYIMKIKGKFKYDDNYKIKFVNGAFGGTTPKGEIEINFYFEDASLPENYDITISDEGRIGKMEINEPEEPFTRYVESGVIMTLDVAKSIHKWLGENIKAAESINLINGGK